MMATVGDDSEGSELSNSRSRGILLGPPRLSHAALGAGAAHSDTSGDCKPAPAESATSSGGGIRSQSRSSNIGATADTRIDVEQHKVLAPAHAAVGSVASAGRPVVGRDTAAHIGARVRVIDLRTARFVEPAGTVIEVRCGGDRVRVEHDGAERAQRYYNTGKAGEYQLFLDEAAEARGTASAPSLSGMKMVPGTTGLLESPSFCDARHHRQSEVVLHGAEAEGVSQAATTSGSTAFAASGIAATLAAAMASGGGLGAAKPASQERHPDAQKVCLLGPHLQPQPEPAEPAVPSFQGGSVASAAEDCAAVSRRIDELERMFSRSFAAFKEEIRCQMEATERRIVSDVLDELDPRVQAEAGKAMARLLGVAGEVVGKLGKLGATTPYPVGAPKKGDSPLATVPGAPSTSEEPEQEYETTADSPSRSSSTSIGHVGADGLSAAADPIHPTKRLEVIGGIARRVFATFGNAGGSIGAGGSSCSGSAGVAHRRTKPGPSLAASVGRERRSFEASEVQQQLLRHQEHLQEPAQQPQRKQRASAWRSQELPSNASARAAEQPCPMQRCSSFVERTPQVSLQGMLGPDDGFLLPRLSLPSPHFGWEEDTSSPTLSADQWSAEPGPLCHRDMRRSGDQVRDSSAAPLATIISLPPPPTELPRRGAGDRRTSAAAAPTPMLAAPVRHRTTPSAAMQPPTATWPAAQAEWADKLGGEGVLMF